MVRQCKNAICALLAALSLIGCQDIQRQSDASLQSDELVVCELLTQPKAERLMQSPTDYLSAKELIVDIYDTAPEEVESRAYELRANLPNKGWGWEQDNVEYVARFREDELINIQALPHMAISQITINNIVDCLGEPDFYAEGPLSHEAGRLVVNLLYLERGKIVDILIPVGSSLSNRATEVDLVDVQTVPPGTVQAIVAHAAWAPSDPSLSNFEALKEWPE